MGLILNFSVGFLGINLFVFWYFYVNEVMVF